jgi:hypothetical protein
MSIGWDVVQRGFMLGLKKDHTKPYLLAQVVCKNGNKIGWQWELSRYGILLICKGSFYNNQVRWQFPKKN